MEEKLLQDPGKERRGLNKLKRLHNDVKTKNLFIQELAELIEHHPEYSIAQHITSIFRPKKDSYHWSDEYVVKKLNNHRNQLDDYPINEENDLFLNQ